MTSHDNSRTATVPADILRAFGHICLKNSEYDLVHGKRATQYLDVDEMSGIKSMAQPDRSANHLLDYLVAKIKEIHETAALNAVVFIERDAGPIGLLTARDYIAIKTGLPTAIVRPRKRIARHSLKGGQLSAGDRVVIITDVSTTGRTIAAAAEVVWRVGARIAAVISMVDRDQGAKEYLEYLDVPLEYVTTLHEIEAACSD